ncbi:MAG TPA: hypothetical protein VLX90_07330 [Steroidobacteraceae bacterium]|nr:hypothetical protein [Steroidobacteraceae bacterium]
MKPRAASFRHASVRHWAAPWVLAMLCLRALVPAGFMLAPVNGRLDVVLCDSDAPGAMHSAGTQLPMHAMPGDAMSGASMPGHGAMHHHGGAEHSGHHHTHPDPTCPYAQSAGPAPLPALPVLPAAQAAVLRSTIVESAQTHSQFGPSREQSPRGPPRLA